ncbi:MAG: hypothetical protein KKB82_07205 [Candidatus Omnitrophica bacterium]|nr:hypothetical protein [Candidatus Omnitrophota bacterium]MBU1925690.1 hypothetical protein [Candidatus Omnitrophota bacterium]
MNKIFFKIFAMTLVQTVLIMNTAWAGAYCRPQHQVSENSYLSPRIGINNPSLQNIFDKGILSELGAASNNPGLSGGAYQALTDYSYELAARLSYPDQSNLGERLRRRWMEENQDIRWVLPHLVKRSLGFFAGSGGAFLDKDAANYLAAQEQFMEMAQQLKFPAVSTTTFFLRYGNYWVKPLV